MKRFLLILLLIVSFGSVWTQNLIDIKAELIPDSLTIRIQQRIKYQNTTSDTLKTIYLSDWNNSYSTKTTPLAKRFEEEFSTRFHLAKNRERGFTVITSLKNQKQDDLDFHYLKDQPDVLKVDLNNPLLPGEFYDISLQYLLRIPNSRFTGYGVNLNKDFNLKDWYITPVVYNGKWNYYSNKNLADLYVPVHDISLQITHPNSYQIITELDLLNNKSKEGIRTSIFEGKNRVDNFMAITKVPRYRFVGTDDFVIISDINEQNLLPQNKVLLTDNITRFLTKNLGDYPHKKLVVTELDYQRNPLYGLNQLPNFLQPFPNQLQYELKLLKTALEKYLDNVLLLNPRKDYWLSEGIQIYFMIKYVEEYHPDSKFLGNLSNAFIIRSSHAADLGFNFQYFLYFMEIARRNNDQPLTTSKDSLIKFNSNIAGKYKAGLGLKYLDAYMENTDFDVLLKSFIQEKKLKALNSADFEAYVKKQTPKNIDWFFDDYVDSRVKFDYKIKDLETTEDSIKLTIKNKRNNTVPVQLYTLGNDSVISKTWIEGFNGLKTLTIPNNGIERVALDHERIIPEFNQRDNYRSTKGFFFNRKPLQLRLFKDIEDPYYNQMFIMPLVEFNNIYDGLTLGARFYNKSILKKRLNYSIAPQYAFNSKTITGGGSVFYTHNIEDSNLFDITYGIGGGYRSFAQDAFVTSIQPSIRFIFRDNDDFRSDKRDILQLRLVSIKRDLGPDAVINLTDPDYDVLNLRYVKSNPGIINYSRIFTDFQVAKEFSKLSFNYEYRHLSKNNRNYGIRFFAGVFLNNDTNPDSDYFSFALDRPTDYLFDLNYFGRSEASGFFSQQIIIAEGGFKSQLEPAFANEWITTVNGTTSIWRYIQAYGDLGLVKNRGVSPQVVYGTGIRVVLVEDFFEVFFPVYSNLGWEIAQPNYGQRIRFMFTLEPKVLLRLFTRKWY